MSLIKKIEERARLFAQMRAIQDKVDAESRDYTAEEMQESLRIEGRIGELDAEIGLRQRTDALQPNPALEAGGETRDAKGAEEETRQGTDSAEYRNALTRFGLGLSLTPEHRAALAVGATGTGGYLVPKDLENNIVRAARDFGVIRALATVITTASGNEYDIPKGNANVTAAWVGEASGISESEPTFAQVAVKAFKMAVYSKASWEVLQDSVIDLEAYLAQQYGEAKAVLENTAYVTGTGSTGPSGILDGTKGLQSGQIVTGADFESGPAAITSDDLFDLYHKVKAAYRRNGSFVMADTTALALRKLKNTTTGDYLWQPGLQADQPDRLLGRPVYTDPDVPAVAFDAKSVIFGDFKRGYLIRDVAGLSIQRLNELYAINGQVGFVMHQRQDGVLVDDTALAAFQLGSDAS